MAERLSESPDVVARNRREPLGDAPVNVDALLLRNLASGSAANQVVGQPEDSARFDGDSSHDELASRLLSPLRLPAIERGRVGDRERPPGDRQERHERSCVPARAAETRCDEAPCLRHSAASYECLDPERRPAGQGGDVPRLVVPERRSERLRELKRVAARQRTELEPREPIARKYLRERGRERRFVRRRTPSGNQSQRLTGGLSGADEVVAECNREFVHPLQVVEEDECGLDRPHRLVRGLEHAQRLQSR